MKTTRILFFLFIGQLFSTLPAAAAPDTYLGDTSIYAAVDSGTERPRPHILFIIDTSQSTMNKAAGTPYDPATVYAGAFGNWNIYVADNQGEFTTNNLQVANTTSNLDNLTCRAVVYDSLTLYGTYSGSGTSVSPNLKGGACDIAPKGATYAVGNYLNYLNPAGGTADTLVQNRYDCAITYTSRGKQVTTAPIGDGCIGTFKLVTSHTTDTTSEPGVGADWQRYWAQVSGGCYGPASTYCSTASAPALLTLSATTPPPWTTGVSLSVSAAQAGLTQRELIYTALEEAVGGARNAVNFGALAFNPQNQGADIRYEIADLRSSTAFTAFLASVKNAPLIASGPNRPQGEALFDAGHYYGVDYPETGPVTLDSSTGLLTITGATSRTIGVNSSIKSIDFGDTKRNPCDFNHIILITNGLSNGDSNPAMKAVVDSDGDRRADESVYGQGSHYADDIAAYLKKHSKITVHSVLAFQAEDPLVHRIATNGGGKFFNVYDASGLAEALNKILSGIVNDVDTSFVAPVVPASSTNRTVASNRIYLGLFKPQSNAPWYGNLKKYGVDDKMHLLDKTGAYATDATGEFISTTKSYWGAVGSQIMGEGGLLAADKGDGGVVPAGGVGGQLKIDLLAAAAESTPRYEIRNIYTKSPASGPDDKDLTLGINRFVTTNTLGLTATHLGNITETQRTALIKFLHGYDGFDDNADGITNTVKKWVLGDILHSKPLIFNYSKFTAEAEGTCPPGANTNQTMIYVGANDGMVHAFRDCDGREAWAFIPPNLLPVLKDIRLSDHNYFSDGSSVAYVHDINNDNVIDAAGGDKVVLVFGQRRGGGHDKLTAGEPRGSYFALDVSEPLVPKLLWSVDSNTSGFGELGETWSQPLLGKVLVNVGATPTRTIVAVVGAGYDNNEDLRFGKNQKFPGTTTDATNTTLPTPDGSVTEPNSAGTADQHNARGRGLYVIKVAQLEKDANDLYQPNFTGSGTPLWAYTSAQNPELVYSIPSDVALMDYDGNGFSDRVYTGDTGGRLWRFDIGSAATSDWSGHMIFDANSDFATKELASEAEADSKGKGRKFFYRPAVARVSGVPTLYVASGDREHPLNRGVVDRLYAIKDRDQSAAKGNDALVNLTANELQAATTTTYNPVRISELLGDLQSDVTKYGWYIDLENAGEKCLASATVYYGQAFYTTYAPKSPEALDQCEIGNLGVSRLYHLDAITGEAVYNYAEGNDGATTNERAVFGAASDGKALTKVVVDGVLHDDRVKTLGEGIPPPPIITENGMGLSSGKKFLTLPSPGGFETVPLYWLQW